MWMQCKCQSRTSLAAWKDSNLAMRKKTFKNCYRWPAHRYEQMHFVQLKISATDGIKTPLEARLQYCRMYCGKISRKKELFSFSSPIRLNSLIDVPLRPSNTSLISFRRMAMSHSWDSQASQNTSRFSLAILLVGCRARVCAAEMILEEKLGGNSASFLAHYFQDLSQHF